MGEPGDEVGPHQSIAHTASSEAPAPAKPGGDRTKDPTRRAALVAAAITVPVVVAVLVAVNALAPDTRDGPGSVTSAPVRPDTVVEVPTPPVTPEADALCPALLEALPLELVGDSSRRVSSQSPFAYAWGEPATVLVCGADVAMYPPDALLIFISGVTWFVDTADSTTTVWTTTDRAVAVQVQIPTSTDGAAATALSPLIDQTLTRTN